MTEDQLIDSDHPTDESTDEMDLFDHLGELRLRLIHCFGAIFVGGVVCYFFSATIFEALTHPFYSTFSDPSYRMIGTGPAEAFILKLKAAFFMGLIVASPYLFYQLWLFIAPGLYEHERKLVLPFVGGSTFLFLLGVSFCYFLVLPIALEFFHDQYLSLPQLTPEIRITEYLALVIKAIIGFGIVFELPILAYFLARMGIIDDHLMIRYARHAIVAVFLLSAILTPPDIMSQLMMAGGLMFLYAISIFIVRYSHRPRVDEQDG